jgi:hypothetical protein
MKEYAFTLFAKNDSGINQIKMSSGVMEWLKENTSQFSGSVTTTLYSRIGHYAPEDVYLELTALCDASLEPEDYRLIIYSSDGFHYESLGKYPCLIKIMAEQNSPQFKQL